MRISGGTVLFVGVSLLLPLVGTASPTAAHAATPERAAAIPPYGATWVADSSGHQLVEYAVGASGRPAPVASILGAATGLSDPTGVVVDSAGDVYASNAGTDAITEYAPGADGNATPLTDIQGSRTQLDAPSSLALSQNELWVTDPDEDLVEAFTAGSTGNILPAATVSGPATGLNHPVDLSAAPDFGMWVLNAPSSGKPSLEQIGFADGDVAPFARIRGSRTGLTATSIILAGPSDSVYAADPTTDTVAMFSADERSPGNTRPVSTLSGSATGLDRPVGLALDAAGMVSVLNAGSHTVEAFRPYARGNASPRGSFGGVASGAAAITVVAGPPSPPTHIHVAATNHGVHVTWRRSRETGGGLVHYEVLALPEGTGGFIFALGGPTTNHRTVRHLHDGVRYDVIVEADNLFGSVFSSGEHFATPHGPPRAPRAVSAAPASARGDLDVVWARPRDNGGRRITAYRVEITRRHFHPTVRVARFSASSRRRHLVLRGLHPGRRYAVRVVAVNPYGVSPPSRVVHRRAAG